MSFVYIHTGYLGNPKLLLVSDKAKLLHLASILWTAEQLTDGWIPPSALRTLSETVQIVPRHRLGYAGKLVSAGLWDALPSGWHVHDFETHNRSSTRAVVEANRAAAAERQRRYRERHEPP